MPLRRYKQFGIFQTTGFNFDIVTAEQLICILHELRAFEFERFFGMGIAVDFCDITASRPGLDGIGYNFNAEFFVVK